MGPSPCLPCTHVIPGFSRVFFLRSDGAALSKANQKPLYMLGYPQTPRHRPLGGPYPPRQRATVRGPRPLSAWRGLCDCEIVPCPRVWSVVGVGQHPPRSLRPPPPCLLYGLSKTRRVGVRYSFGIQLHCILICRCGPRCSVCVQFRFLCCGSIVIGWLSSIHLAPIHFAVG